jgi:hypothetical protein
MQQGKRGGRIAFVFALFKTIERRAGYSEAARYFIGAKSRPKPKSSPS